MGRHYILLVASIAVGVVSLVDGAGRSFLTENPRNQTIHSQNGKQQVENGSTVDDSIDPDGGRFTHGFLPDTTFSTRLPGFGDTMLHHATAESEEVNSSSLVPNHTFSDLTDVREGSSTRHDTLFSNELRKKNRENVSELQLDIDSILNVSDLTNHTLEKVKFNCSMLNSITFKFTLGRKMPVYIDIICLAISVIGIVGNVATVAVVAINVKLRKQYFLTILTLAVADLIGIVFKLVTILSLNL
jgi:hypothetical protein